MEMRAYPSDYLDMAQRVMGDMLDFAVNTCNMDIDEFYTLFLASDISTQLQDGNPTYLAGKTGCEIVKEVIKESGMDIMHFVNAVNDEWNNYYIDTNLGRLRKLAGLSQKELAMLSGVSLRQIQLFEQRQRDINHTKAIDVVKLGRVLGCKMEELLQI